MKRYPRYRDSGVEWIGEIPEDWGVSRLKYLASAKMSGVDKKTLEGESHVRLCNYTDVYKNECISDEIDFMEASATKSEREQMMLQKGDVLITKDSETPDDIAVPAFVKSDLDNVLCGYHLARIRADADHADSEYLFRTFCAQNIREQFTPLANGITRYGLSKYSIDNALFPVPPLSEQRKVGPYLDRKTRQVDELIDKKRSMLELLKEERAEVIAHAVTKGLDPKVKMKESGIEWQGEVPAHWELLQIKWLFDSWDYGISDNLSGDGVYRVLTMSHMQNGGLVLPDKGCLDEVSPERVLDDGDLLFNRTNSADLVAKVALFKGTKEDKVSFASYLVRFRVNDKALPEYLNFLLNSTQFISYARSLALPSINQSNLNPTRYSQIKVSLPPVNEQANILKYLKDKCGQIDTLITKEETLIATLQEYRTALISEVVTGKIEVRDVA